MLHIAELAQLTGKSRLLGAASRMMPNTLLRTHVRHAWEDVAVNGLTSAPSGIA